MLKLGYCFGFRSKPFEALFSRKRSCQEDLHRDNPVQRYLPRFENYAHTASAYFLQQLVITHESSDSAGIVGRSRGSFMPGEFGGQLFAWCGAILGIEFG